MDWQETLISLCLRWIPGHVEEPEPLKEPSGYREAMIQISRTMATALQSRELRSLQPDDVVLRIYEVQSSFQDVQEKLGTSANPTSLSIQRSVVLVHTSHFITNLCQRVFISARKTGNTHPRDTLSRLSQLCIDNAILTTKEYVWLLQLNAYTKIAVRSFHLMYNGLGAALLLADLGELRRNSSARSTVQELLLHALLFDRKSGADPTWEERALKRLSILVAKAESGPQQDHFEPLRTPLAQSTRMLNSATVGPSTNQLASGSSVSLAQQPENDEAQHIAQQFKETLSDHPDNINMNERGQHSSYQTPRLNALDPHMPGFNSATGRSTLRYDFTSLLEDYGVNGNTPAQHAHSLLAQSRRGRSSGGDSDVEDLEIENGFSFVEDIINDPYENSGNFSEAASLLDGA